MKYPTLPITTVLAVILLVLGLGGCAHLPPGNSATWTDDPFDNSVTVAHPIGNGNFP